MSGEELGQLRAEVASLRELVGRTVSLTEQEQDLTAEAIARLENAVTDLLGRPGQTSDAATGEGEEEVPEATAWVDYATDENWVALCDWVDWLVGVYDLHDDRRVRPCWPAHLGVAEELAALWSAWLEAASRAREAEGDALAFWHDRYLTPFLARVNRVYQIGLCREKHTTMRPAGLTNRTLIDVRSAATDEDSDASGPVLAGAPS
ncbi:MAG: hypothetical protein L0H96_25975 [Humibacillus sp.]|nr:hypothetical protein [Humibacillus sp.]